MLTCGVVMGTVVVVIGGGVVTGNVVEGNVGSDVVVAGSVVGTSVGVVGTVGVT